MGEREQGVAPSASLRRRDVLGIVGGVGIGGLLTAYFGLGRRNSSANTTEQTMRTPTTLPTRDEESSLDTNSPDIQAAIEKNNAYQYLQLLGSGFLGLHDYPYPGVQVLPDRVHNTLVTATMRKNEPTLQTTVTINYAPAYGPIGRRMTGVTVDHLHMLPSQDTHAPPSLTDQETFSLQVRPGSSGIIDFSTMRRNSIQDKPYQTYTTHDRFSTEPVRDMELLSQQVLGTINNIYMYPVVISFEQ